MFAVACSSPDNAGESMTLHVAGPLSALDRGKMAPGAQPDYVIMVPTCTLDDILEEAEAPRPIDLLSVDVEGHEIEVLLGFDFEYRQPKLILLEDHVESLDKHLFLKQSGYRLIRRAGNNGWYVPGASAVKPTWDGRWQIVRKYYLALPFRMARNVVRRIRRLFSDWVKGR